MSNDSPLSLRTARPRGFPSFPHGALLASLLLAGASAAKSATTKPGLPSAAEEVPVRVRVLADASELPKSGSVTLRYEFTVDATIRRALRVRLEVRAGRKQLWVFEHAPERPSREWKKGETVRYENELRYPLKLVLDKNVRSLGLYFSFVDPAKKNQLLAPKGTKGKVPVLVARLPLAPAPESASLENLDGLLERADELAKDGKASRAWRMLGHAFRRTNDYAQKRRIRDLLFRIGRFAPRGQSGIEKEIVASRIRREKARYLRLVASRMHGRGQILGAYYLLKLVGGQLQEGVDDAHVGSVKEVRRTTRSIEQLRHKILSMQPEGWKDRLAAAREKLGEGKRLFEYALALQKKREWAEARETFRIVSTSNDRELAKKAKQQLTRTEALWLEDVPKEEKRIADEAINHPAWARTTSIESHEFVILGPKELLQGISRESALRFDIAYLYITDLFGRVPNPLGDRVTVYFKELWDFGGGQGGGKIIDIGNADPFRKTTRLDTGLFYHELTHCVDDTNPVVGGFREGLADFSAAFTFHALAQNSGARWAFRSNLEKFKKDYLDRDLLYYRIPDYGPSAGFFLHFIEAYGKSKDGYRWELYRRFFRDYRSCRMKDGRTETVARAYAWHLRKIFGDGAFDDLIRYRFPLRPDDRDAIAAEQKELRSPWLPEPSAFRRYVGSPVPRDVSASDLLEDRAELAAWTKRLGILTDWHAIGPFKEKGCDPGARAFPPEREIDFSKSYEVPQNTAVWQQPQARRAVRVDRTGWLSFHYSYMDNSAIYAVTHVEVPRATRAFIHMRGDDDLTLFVGDRLIGKYRNQGGGLLGPWRPARSVHLADAVRFPVRLAPGRNKILVKIRNYSGGAGFILAVTGSDGLALPGLRQDKKPAEHKSSLLKLPSTLAWRRRFKINFAKGGGTSKFDIAGGRFRVRNKSLSGYGKGSLPWRKYTVRPGFKRDAPRNLLWLKSRATKGIGDLFLRVDLDLRDGAPKLCVILQGEGNKDPLSGWTLILTPSGSGARSRLQARLERYDRLVYQSGFVPIEAGRKKTARLELLYFQRRLHVTLNGKPLLVQLPIRRIPGRHSIGLATWNDRTRIRAIEVRAQGKSSR